MAANEVWRELLRATRDEIPCALVTVVRTEKSAPVAAGAMMLVTRDGAVVGSVSGGCVDSDAHAQALLVIESGIPVQCAYGVSDSEEFGVGLTCGGTIELFIQPVDDDVADVVREVSQRLDALQPVAQVTVINGSRSGTCMAVVGPDGAEVDSGWPKAFGPWRDSALRDTIVRDARAMLGRNLSGIRTYGEMGQRLADEVDVFIMSRGLPDRLIIFGAVDFSGALATTAKFLGFHVTVCDPRPVFATAERFPDADEVVVDWPDRWLAGQDLSHTASICVLTHDPRFDVPVLRIALGSRAGYVGAMGSRATHHERLHRLRAAGVTSEQLERLHSPIGLDLGACTPQETAISIVSEIIKNRNGATGQSLAVLDGPIHEISVSALRP